MKMRTLVAVAALGLASGAAAFAQDVKVDFDKAANFAAIKTFAVKIGTSWNNPLSEKRILGEIEEALVAKGRTKADAAQADAIVVLHGATEKQKSLNTFYSGMGGYGGYGWRGWGGGMGTGTATTTTSEYMVGTLVVDIFDAITTARPYRPMLTPAEATSELGEEARIGLLPAQLVGEFVAMRPQVHAPVEPLQHGLDGLQDVRPVGIGAQEAEDFVQAPDLVGPRETRPGESSQAVQLMTRRRGVVPVPESFQIAQCGGRHWSCSLSRRT